jgi:D5 N terminal like
LYAQAADLPDSTPDQAKIKFATEKHARRSESAKGRKDALDCLAAEQDGIPISETELDPDPFLLNTVTGTIDLRTGKIREHRRADVISTLIPIEYDGRAECPLFQQFIHRIMGGGPDASEADIERADRLVNYLQRAFGVAETDRLPRGRDGQMTVTASFGQNPPWGRVFVCRPCTPESRGPIHASGVIRPSGIAVIEGLLGSVLGSGSR